MALKHTYIAELPRTPIGAHASNSSLSSAVTLTCPSGATGLMLQALTQNIRYTIDSTTPTASIGFQWPTGDVGRIIPMSPGQIINIIQETSGAVIQYQWVNI